MPKIAPPKVESPILELFGVATPLVFGSVREFTVEPLEISMITSLIEEIHYSHNVTGIQATHCFGLFHGTTLIYGPLAMPGVYKKYVDDPDDIIELRRLACVEEAPRNTESYFIGQTLRWLKRNTKYKVVISYADSHHGHKGIIYQASNFEHVGMTLPSKLIDAGGGLFYHDRALRNYRTDKFGVKRLKKFAQKLLDALASGDAKIVQTSGKHTYIYRLKPNAKVVSP